MTGNFSPCGLEQRISVKFVQTWYDCFESCDQIKYYYLCLVLGAHQFYDTNLLVKALVIKPAGLAASRLSPVSCGVIFKRARVSLTLLSLRKNGDYS